ncbi:hypothetical protein F8271_10390 [Micromonospora sp. ALFpr18c]|uniref:hypothetical protein n=1 Tax=Micromonospora sp. ALFpr18c TaxID=1458665 RepID=UPI00124B50BE|nr:hypothetical protein [Micromonospora sp. ALFpr18c]KAB1943169.1 hypothetical protein F8271_10390 [Micromonospora sp. ALFpr18c]
MAERVRSGWELRSRAEIEYMLAHLVRVYAPTHDYARGGAAVCRWILGHDHASPVTGQFLGRPVTCNDVRHEGYEAQVAMSNGGRPAVSPPVDPLSINYLNGVDDWALWVTGGQGVSIPDDWPFDQGPPLGSVR